MAQAGGDAQVVSQFPHPPRHYYASLGNSESPLPAPPPPPGENASYQMFGRVYTTTDKLPTLQESGRPILYSEDEPPTAELLRLNDRLLSLFHILLVTLSSAGAPHENVVARIEDVLINMQHLLNTLRPAQAARDLRCLLDSQAAARLDTARTLGDTAKTAEESVGEVSEMLAKSAAGAQKEDEAAAANVRAALAVAEAHLKRDKERAENGPGGVARKRVWYSDPEAVVVKAPGVDAGDEAGNSEADVAKRRNRALFSADLIAAVDRVKNDTEV